MAILVILFKMASYYGGSYIKHTLILLISKHGSGEKSTNKKATTTLTLTHKDMHI